MKPKVGDTGMGRGGRAQVVYHIHHHAASLWQSRGHECTLSNWLARSGEMVTFCFDGMSPFGAGLPFQSSCDPSSPKHSSIAPIMNGVEMQVLTGMAKRRRIAGSPLNQGKTTKTRLFILCNLYTEAPLNSARLPDMNELRFIAEGHRTPKNTTKFVCDAQLTVPGIFQHRPVCSLP
jgi:hypothetical protein